VRGFHSSALVRATAVSDAHLHSVSARLASSPAPPMSIANALAKGQPKLYGELEDEVDLNDSSEDVEVDPATRALRERYLPTLAAEPFWRPLLSMSFSTRPLATSVARLARRCERGLPFYVTIPPEDRLCHHSYPTRMRNLRINRLLTVTLEAARVLRGDRGGFVGIRFGPEDRGRGVGGEKLETPIPHEKRLITVGVGKWYKRADEVTRIINAEVGDAELGNAVETLALDDHGHRMDGVPWAQHSVKLEFFPSVEAIAMRYDPSFDPSTLTTRKKRVRLSKIVNKHKEEMSMTYASLTRSVAVL